MYEHKQREGAVSDASLLFLTFHFNGLKNGKKSKGTEMEHSI